MKNFVCAIAASVSHLHTNDSFLRFYLVFQFLTAGKGAGIFQRDGRNALQCRAGKERLVAGNDHIGEAEQHRHHLVFQHIVGEILEHLVILILVHIQTHAAELAKISKRSALQMALNGKVYDPSDIIGLLDMDKIEVSDDGSLKTDLEGLLKPIKESKAYLFKEDPAKTPPVHGATPADPGPKTPPAAGKVDGPVCL